MGRMTHPTGPLRSLIPPVVAFPFFLIAYWYAEQIPLNPQDVEFVRKASQALGLGMVLILAPVPLHGAQPATARYAPPVAAALLLLLYQMALLQLFFRVMALYPFLTWYGSFGGWLMSQIDWCCTQLGKQSEIWPRRKLDAGCSITTAAKFGSPRCWDCKKISQSVRKT